MTVLCLIALVLIGLYIYKYANHSKAKADLVSLKDSLKEAKDAFVASRTKPDTK
jgi:hypothetical protein